MPVDTARLDTLTALARKALWLSSWDHPSRQPRPHQLGWPEGRGTSGLVGLARDHHVGAVFPCVAP
ncbi:hypothetical protein ACVWWG_005591 [Bradyrhizobium sp. LB7.2]